MRNISDVEKEASVATEEDMINAILAWKCKSIEGHPYKLREKVKKFLKELEYFGV